MSPIGLMESSHTEQGQMGGGGVGGLDPLDACRLFNIIRPKAGPRPPLSKILHLQDQHCRISHGQL